MTVTGITISVFIFLFYIFIVHADNTCPFGRRGAYHDEGRLLADLLCDYKPNFRPVENHNSTVTVKVRFALKYISFDVLEETFTVHSWVAISWKDAFLKWTPSDYSNIKEIQINSENIWTPRLSLFNSDVSMFQRDSLETTCLLTNDGTVTCVPHIAHSGICAVTLRRWPYDSHNCTMYFGSWMHTGEQINFTFYNTKPVLLDDYQNGPGWRLLNVTNERLPGDFICCPNSTYPMLKYVFILRREATGPAAIVVSPSIVLVILTITSLLLSIKDSTRIYMLCFSLFGHFTFLIQVGYNIPKHSVDTPILLLFLRDSMFLTLFGVLETLVLMFLKDRAAPVPMWIVRANRLVTSGPSKYVVFTEFDPSYITNAKSVEDDIVSEPHQPSHKVSDWIKLANWLNSFIFIISVLVYIILISVYIPNDD